MRKELGQLVDLDDAVRATTIQRKQNSLVLFTADHAYFLLMRGEHMVENNEPQNGKDGLKLIGR
jgi:alkaline phosphatase